MTLPAKKTYQKFLQQKIDSEFIRNKLKLKSLQAKKELFENYPDVKKFLDEKGIDLDRIREHSARIIASGALTGALILTPPAVAEGIPTITEMTRNVSDFNKQGTLATIPPQEFLLNSIKSILPAKTAPLNSSQEKYLEQVFREALKIPAKANLEGEHLNTTYGLIGAEQNLMRYPGDNVTDMAPGKGAWGYFAPSKSQLTQEDIDREKWYAVVQTLYLPDWSRRQPYLKDWYKYRKVLIVNTLNGNAVIADIADSGPAAWTGKHFGGSPEVMNYLGGTRYKKGPVLVFFVDDPENKIPLGPVDYNNVKIAGTNLVEA